METNLEFCDPFDSAQSGFWMKLEHCGRYLWARDILAQNGCRYVADVACANGYGSRILSAGLPHVLGVDRNHRYLSEAETVNAAENLHYVCADLNTGRLPAEMSSADGIVCFETLEHVLEPVRLLEAFANTLPSGGTLLLSVPNEHYERYDEQGNNRDSFHLHVFSREHVTRLLAAAGFEIEETLGQDLCNRMVSKISCAAECGLVDKSAFERIWPYDRERILLFSQVFGYPCGPHAEESYSYIFRCRRTDRNEKGGVRDAKIQHC